MINGTEYYELLQDLHDHARKASSAELEQLVQKSLVAMALEVADKEPVPIKALTSAYHEPCDLSAMQCKTV